jgi:hypothetical protein
MVANSPQVKPGRGKIYKHFIGFSLNWSHSKWPLYFMQNIFFCLLIKKQKKFATEAASSGGKMWMPFEGFSTSIKLRTQSIIHIYSKGKV